MDLVSNLIPPHLSSNYMQASGGNFSSSVPYASVSGTSQAFEAGSSGFRMDGSIQNHDDATPDAGNKAPADDGSLLGIGLLKISRKLEQNAIAEVLFNGAKNETELRAYYAKSSIGKKEALRDLSVGISVLRKMGGDPAKCDEFTKKFREYLVKDRKLGWQKSEASAFYAWTDKKEKLFIKINRLREDIEKEVTKIGLDPFYHQKDTVSTPATIAYLEERIGELTEKSLREIKAADGLISYPARQMVERLNNLYKEWREDGIDDRPFDGYVKQIYLAWSMPEYSRKLTPMGEKKSETESADADPKKKL